MARAAKFFWWSKHNDQFFFHLKAPNGEIILQSESYKTKQACLAGIRSIKRYAEGAEVLQAEKGVPIGKTYVTGKKGSPVLVKLPPKTKKKAAKKRTKPQASSPAPEAGSGETE